MVAQLRVDDLELMGSTDGSNGQIEVDKTYCEGLVSLEA